MVYMAKNANYLFFPKKLPQNAPPPLPPQVTHNPIETQLGASDIGFKSPQEL